MTCFCTPLSDRGAIAISGVDTDTFLQGIVSNDVTRVTDTQAGFGAFLTPQGKYLFDFFMIRMGDVLLLDAEKSRLDGFIKRLSMYKLRAQADVRDASADYQVFALFGDDLPDSVHSQQDGVLFTDPRLEAAGARAIVTKDSGAGILKNLDVKEADFATYDRHRIALGLPDSSRDLIVEKSALLENGFDELNGVDWNKGCYMGQEVTARTKHRGLVKKRLVPVEIHGTAPEPGTPVMAGDREAGEMRSASGDMGLALIKLDYMAGETPLTAGNATLHPRKPSWATF